MSDIGKLQGNKPASSQATVGANVWAETEAAERAMHQGAATAQQGARVAGEAARQGADATADVTRQGAKAGIEAMRRASTESQAGIARAIAEAKAEAAVEARAADERLEAQLAQAEQRIHAARNAAVGALREVALETAHSVVTRLTGHAANDGALSVAVDGAIAARG